MRIIYTLKNSIYGILSYAIVAGLSLLIRRVFLHTLPIEILGYEGLFGSVFSLISLADLGMESVILYRLFPAFAKEDKREINRIMAAYKYLYRIVGMFVLGIGIIIIPFLHLLIPEGDYNWSFVYTIYIIQLLLTLTSYFLAYKRILFQVSQKEFVCIKIDTVGSIIFGLLRLGSLLLFKSYYLFLLCNLLGSLICNCIISRQADKTFDYYNAKQKVSQQDVRDLKIGKDIKNNLVQKICGVIYGGTDSIVITATLGIANVGLLANYTLFYGYVQKIIDRLMNPFQMSIGNYVHSENQENGLRMFRMFDFISFLIACFVVSCLFCLFNPVITVAFGEKYLLSQEFVAAFCVNQYINWNHHMLCFYRSSLGRYDLDKIPIILAAAMNIVFSLILSRPFGMAGILFGTAIGHLGFWFGRVKVVYTLYICEAKRKYILRQIVRFGCCIAEVAMAYYLCKGLPISIVGIVLRFFAAGILPFILNGLLFWKTEEMKNTIEYLRKIRRLVKDKAKKMLGKAEH